MRAHSLAVLLAGCLVGCGVPTALATSARDGGGSDVGPDASVLDAGEPVPDAGIETPDAGPTTGDGCGTSTVGPGNYDWQITSGGTSRKFHVHVPASYSNSIRTPLVVTFHGLSSTSNEIEDQSVMTAVSDESGFIVVYPQGIGNSWNAGKCCGSAMSSSVDDIAFVRDMLHYLGTQLCVDTKRIYATGLSNGAYMSHRVACDLSDRFAAVAPVAGMNVTSSCAPSRPVPVMHFHGTSDYVVPWGGNLLYGFQSVPDSIKQWRTIDQCSDASHQTYNKGDAKCDTYDACAQPNVEVTLCTIDGGGHTWPSGKVTELLGKTSTDIDASRYMWQFFEAHPMP